MRRIAKIMTVCALAAIFTVVALSLALAQTSTVKSGAMQGGSNVSLAPGTLQCPPGWHQTKHNSEEFRCAPNKPAPITCPKGWKYVEALNCQPNIGLTGQTTSCDGCLVGCVKIPVIK